MQDNEPLMRSLTKLISVNAPDLVLFVGEALVGRIANQPYLSFKNKFLCVPIMSKLLYKMGHYFLDLQ